MTRNDLTAPVFNIGAVARRTGIKADRVRAWERRYGAVVPARTQTDRRLYSDADIRRLALLREATELGHRISHIAALSDPQLNALIDPMRATEELQADPEIELEARLARCLAAIENLDAGRLQAELERASFDYARITLVEDYLVPLMGLVGTRWRHGELDPAQEHLATATIRSFVSGFVRTQAQPTAPTIVITTPAGQLHELGAILAAATAAAEGWRVVYLGPNLPADSIAAAAHRCGATAVALGIPSSDLVTGLNAELESLAVSLDGTHLILGGLGVAILEPLADRLGFIIVRNLADFRGHLCTLESEHLDRSHHQPMSA